MRLKIFPDYHSLSEGTAEQIFELINAKPDTMFCLASGDTPRLTCKLFAEKAIKRQLDISKTAFIGLDEWLGVPPENEGSCFYFFKSMLLDHLHFLPEQIHFFDALSKDPKSECQQMDEFISKKGPIDLMVVGIGMNGHIGFNEPGTSFENYSHVAELDQTTTSVGQKYFSGAVSLSKGITLGFRHLMESRKLILIANGEKKAGVIRQALEGQMTNAFPASIIQKHPNAIVMIDQKAAAELKGLKSKVD